MSELKEIIKEKSIIILDVFDVLLISLYRNPLNFFAVLEEKNKVSGFSDARLKAQQWYIDNQDKILDQNKGLHLVYDKMHSCYQGTMEKELAFSIATTKLNGEVKAIYDHAIEHKIPVYLCGEFNVPVICIEEILKDKSCLGYKKIYSLTPNFTREKMYQEIINENKVNGSDIIHIKKQGKDIDKEKCGVAVYEYETIYRKYGLNSNSAYFSFLNKFVKEDYIIPMLQNSIASYCFEHKNESEWSKFGYKYFGIIIFEYVKYIGDIAKKLNINNIVFSSKYGRCIKAAFEIIFPEIKSQVITLQEHTLVMDSINQENEKELFNDYLKKLNILKEKSAVVDISKTKDILLAIKGIDIASDLENDLTSFYWEYDPKIRWDFESINNANYNRRQAKDDVWSFSEKILDFAFKEVTNDDRQSFNKISVGLSSKQNNNIDSIKTDIFSGIIECVNDLYSIDKVVEFPVKTCGAMCVFEYFEKHIDMKDKSQIEMVYLEDDEYGTNNLDSFSAKQKPLIGIINPWPEDVSAEAEVITRLKRTAEENGIECVLLDNYGRILNDSQKPTKKFVDEESLKFVITTHYECTKLLNTFYYLPLWNPPEIPLNQEDYATRITNLFRMNDDFLIYDKGGMSNHLRAMLVDNNRTLEGVSALTASFPASSAMAPKQKKPIMFYCGMNWEVMFKGPGRHEGLFKLLDNTKKIEFYGPERVDAWGGLKPWDGYRCYKGMIPFDGFSIIERINECGVCLVLSSDTHRRAGSATNRLYEACAAGAVIISDDNEFVQEHFSDAALFIDFNKNNPTDTFRQIMEKYDWILTHPDEALTLAKRAQEIYLNDYSLDKQLKQIIRNHPLRMKQVKEDLYAQNQEGKVLVTYVLDTQDEKIAKRWMDVVIRNIHGQVYGNIELAVAADEKISKIIKEYCYEKVACTNIFSLKLFDKKGTRSMTDGEAIRHLQSSVRYIYYINTTEKEYWFFDHITSLVRAISDNDCLGAYSGACFEGADGCRRVNFFERLNANHLYYMREPNKPLSAGQFMFHANANNHLPDYLFGCLDGKEHLAYAGVINYKCNGRMSFVKRMTICISSEEEDEHCAILSETMQYRFIQDLIRDYIPEQCKIKQAIDVNTSSFDGKDKVTEMLLILPIKTYIKLRYYRFRMRMLNPEGRKYKKFAVKYDDCAEHYRSFWNV
ncbi:MAG: glycosyltransferase [Aminipila sp.]